MARELRLDVDSKADNKGLDSSAAGVDRLRREANRLGDEFKRAEREAASLDRQLLETKAATAALAKEFSKVDADPALKKQLEESRKATAELQRLRKDIVGDTERDAKKAADAYTKAFDDTERDAKKAADAYKKAFDAFKKKNKDEGFFGLFANAGEVGEKAGIDAADGFMGAIGGAIKSLPPEAQAGIVGGIGAAIVLGAPVIASAVSAAVLLGVGGAGIAAGIALAIKDPQVKQAFTDFGKQASAGLHSAAAPFQAELVGAAHTFSSSFAEIEPDVRDLFADLAKDVQPLARGLAGLVKESLPGLKEAAKAAGPLFQTLADEGPRIGRALSEFFGAVADAGPAANVTLKFILDNVQALIVGTAELVREAAPLIEVYGAFDQAVFGSSVHAATFAARLDDTSSSFSDVATSSRSAAAEVEVFADQLDKAFNVATNAIDADLAYRDSIDQLKESLRAHKGAWDADTEAGRDHIRATEDAIKAAYAKMQADIASGTAAAYAREQFQAQANAILAQARAAGASAAVIRELTASWAAFLSLPNTSTKTVRVNVVQAVSQQGVIAGGVPLHGAYAKGGVRRAAAGMVVAPSDPGTVLMGEPQTGGEVLIPRRGISRGAAMGLAGLIGQDYNFRVSGAGAAPRVPAQLWSGRSSGDSGARPGHRLPPLSIIEQALATVILKLQATGQLPG